MRANRARDTAPERTLRKALREAGYPGYRLNWRAVPGRPDVSYPGRRVAVFVHGCFWHHCPRCQPRLPRANQGFWARKFELNRERDARKRAELEARGWVVHEVWECDIRERLPEVVGTIASDLAVAGGRAAH
jgi:DNA mismatch endonuclease (patch repair protein)